MEDVIIDVQREVMIKSGKFSKVQIRDIINLKSLIYFLMAMVILMNISKTYLKNVNKYVLSIILSILLLCQIPVISI
jgi:hypothetical protein